MKKKKQQLHKDHLYTCMCSGVHRKLSILKSDLIRVKKVEANPQKKKIETIYKFYSYRWKKMSE